MTTDREAACWLMAALLVVVLTFSAAGCGTRPPSTAAAEAPFAAAAPTTRWTINDEADALPNLVAAAERAGVAERDRAAALGFDDLEIDATATVVPLFTLEQTSQLDAVVLPDAGVLETEIPTAQPHPVAPTEDDQASDALAPAGTSGATGTPVAAGGALTDALTRGLQAAGGYIAAASPGAVALGLGGAAVFAFGLQALAMVLSLREPAQGPRLTLGPAPTPSPRPPAGGAARPLPFPLLAASGHLSFSRAA